MRSPQLTKYFILSPFISIAQKKNLKKTAAHKGFHCTKSKYLVAAFLNKLI